MARYVLLPIAAICLALSACVTINVYFPTAAAEKAADKIIDDVWGPQARQQDSSRPDSSQRRENERSALDEGLFSQSRNALLAAAGAALELLIPSAHAQADLNISTPAVRALTQSMEARHAELRRYYDSGAIGLTRDGLVQVRDQNLIPLPERNAVRKLVADENADRTNLYREIAAANNHPDWEPDIRSTFAERWVSKASAGWYYQGSDGSWKQK